MKKITFLITLLCTSASFAQSFTENFNTDPGNVSSFNTTLQGFPFTFTFTTEGDGGDFAWESINGDGNSPSINALSSFPNLGTTEKITIARADSNDFIFTSIFINNTNGELITVAGYNNGSIVGSAQTVAKTAFMTLNFSDIIVDEVRITSTDFYFANIDSFKGDIDTTLGIESNHFSSNKLSISPNPASNYLTVSEETTAKQYEIYNVLGAKISDGSFINSNQINVENLKNGVYLLKVDNYNAIKFIKQ